MAIYEEEWDPNEGVPDICKCNGIDPQHKEVMIEDIDFALDFLYGLSYIVEESNHISERDYNVVIERLNYLKNDLQ